MSANCFLEYLNTYHVAINNSSYNSYHIASPKFSKEPNMYPEIGFETSFPSHVFEIHLISQKYFRYNTSISWASAAFNAHF